MDKKNKKTKEDTSQDNVSEDVILEQNNDTLLNLKQEIEEKNSLILELETQVKELKEKFLRSLAEMENLRTRSEKNLKEAKDYSISNFAKNLIPVMDSLVMALEHKTNSSYEKNKETEVFDRIIEGVELTKKQLDNVFSKNNIIIIKPELGDDFDYNHHYAISQNDNSNYKPGSIVNVMQAGYKLGNRILRPATVIIAKDTSAS